jgi:uncharacterized RDD family membrane protein YckC
MESMRPLVPEALPPAPVAPPPAAASSITGGRPIAGWGYRIAAFLFDVGLAFAAGIGGAYLAGEPRDIDAHSGVSVLTAIGVWLVITTGAMGVFKGQTLGKRLVGTRVISSYGHPSGAGTSLLRDQLARLLYLVPFFFLIDSVLALRDDGRTLRDRMVSTYVVREAHGVGRAWAVAAAAAALLAVWIAGASAMDRTDATGGYGSFERTMFIEGCSSDGTRRAACGCLYDYISRRVPHSEFDKANRIEDPDRWPPRMQRVTAAGYTHCVSGGSPEPDSPSEEPAQVRDLVV